MAKLHLVGGEKGGVGKSFTARLLAQYYIDNQKPFVGFDSDQSHQTFSRFYGDFTTPLTVDDYESLDGIILSAENHPDRDIIVDLAAQTTDRLVLWLEDSALFELMAEFGFDTYMWHVMDDGADSAFLLKKQLARYADTKVKIIAVQNEGRGDDFTSFDDSPLYDEAQQRGASLIQLTKLQSSIAKKIDFSNASFWAASNNRDGLNIAERQRVRVWLNKQYQKIESCFLGKEKPARQSNIISAQF